MASNKGQTNAPGERQKFYFQFITTPTSDTPGTTLLLHFNTRRYLFGHISEGTQRAFVQRGVGIKKVRNIFVTGPTKWEHIGGLIGMVLTMADIQSDEIDPLTGKRPKIRIQGGPKLTHSIACARRFVFRTGMPLHVCEADLKREKLGEPSYLDDNIDVWSIPAVRRGKSGRNSPNLPHNRSQSPKTVDREQALRAETVRNMFDSDWRKDRLIESRLDEVKLPATVWTRNSDTKELTYTQCNSMADAPHLQPDSKVLVRNPWPASLVEELPPVDNIAGSVAMSYIVRGKPQRGKFMPEKARELGVKPGPNYAILTAGGSVTLENGTVVTSDMVLGKTEPGKGMAILDVPTDEYLEDLSDKIDNLKGNAMEGVETVSWLLGKDVAFSAAFLQLVESLSGLKHIISSPDLTSDYLALDSSAASSIRLAQIRPDCFKVPVHDNSTTKTYDIGRTARCATAERGLIVQVAPQSVLNRSEIPPLLDVERARASYGETLQGLIPASTPSSGSVGPYDDVQILTLGTGSAVPSKYRNVSATLVRVPNLGSYLFDCGENTLGMLRRAYTNDELDELLVDLRMIWISHLHADHHLGILSLIEAKREVMQRLDRTEPKLYVVSEPNMADYLNDYGSIQSSNHCQLLGVLNSEFTSKSGVSPGSKVLIQRTSLPIKEFLTTRVSHCWGAQACSITFDTGFKFSYSGDCRPSAQFAKIGRDSDVILHEATFDDGLEGDAMAKKHSTTGEALAVAHAMRAKNVILTHFSQRYQKIPVLSKVKFGEVRFEEGDDVEEQGPIEENSSVPMTDQLPDQQVGPKDSTRDPVAMLQKVAQEMNVCVAFDLMSVRVGQIRDMYKYYPAIEKMFELEQEKSEVKKEARRENAERLKEEKDVKANKTKNASKEVKRKPAGSVSGNIYDRINRNKTKPSIEPNGSAAPLGQSSVNSTGQERVSDSTRQPLPSPSTGPSKRRQQHGRQNSKDLFVNDIRHRSQNLMRQLSDRSSAEPEGRGDQQTRAAKRTKLE